MKYYGLVLLLIGAIILGYQLWNYSDPYNRFYNYEGQVTLNNAEDYQKFKLAILDNPNIKVNKIDELNSGYPIWMQFDVTALHNTVFPYGEIEPDDSYNIILGLIMGNLMGISGIIALSFYKKFSSESVSKE